MEGIFFGLAMILFSLLSQALRRKPQGPGRLPGPTVRRVRVPVEEPALPRRGAVKTDGAPVLSVAPPMEVPATTGPQLVAQAASATRPALVLDRASVLNGVILSEILGRPRGLHPWRPQGWRH